MSDRWDLNPHVSLQNLVILRTAPWEVSDIFQISAEKFKKYSKGEIRSRTYCMRNFRPNLTAEAIF